MHAYSCGHSLGNALPSTIATAVTCLNLHILHDQVIIVPIFWNKKADEKAAVLATAEEVREQLQEQGISSGLDSTNADTPGQKYCFWYETKLLLDGQVTITSAVHVVVGSGRCHRAGVHQC